MTERTANNILITNFHCASNRGDAAILEGLSHSLNKISTSQIVATEFPNSSNYINNVNSVKQKTAPFRIDRPGRTIAYMIEQIRLSKLSSTFNDWTSAKLNLEPYHNADIIVGTGGHYLTDIYFPGKLGVLWEMNYCKELGKPVVLCGQSVGPIEKFPYKQLTRRVLNKLDAITVRDRQSKKYLESIGISSNVYITADTAFAMELTHEKPLSMRRLEPVPSLSSNPAFTISVRDWSHFGESGMNQYLEGIAELCDHLVRTYDGFVYLLSTCTGFDGYHTDDRVTSHRVFDLLDKEISTNVQIVTGEYTPQELVYLYEEADFHIGTRMHSLVLAMLAGTPVIGVEYQFKTTGLMEMFELEDYVLSINDVDCHSIVELFEKGYMNRDRIRKNIDSKLPEVKKAAQRNVDIVERVLDDYP